MGVFMNKTVKNLYFPIFLGLFLFASTDLQSAKQRDLCFAETQDVQVLQDFAELMNILELRSDAIFHAINESIIRDIETSLSSKRDMAKKQTRNAINAASTAYLMASENVKQRLDRLEQGAQKAGTFTYSRIEKIVADDVLKSEKIAIGDFSIKSLAFQLKAISDILSIKEQCQTMPFLAYVYLIQESYTKAADSIGTKTQLLFLEELNIPKYNIARLCKYLFAAHVRNIIDLAAKAEISLSTSSVKYTSLRIEAHKKKALADIIKERETVYSKLITLDEIKDLISSQLNGLPEKLISRILSLADPENADQLIHYIQIWGEKTKIVSPKDHLRYFSFLNSELESFKKIFSGIDLKKEDSPQNAQNIWPNLVAKLTECKFDLLIRPGGTTQESAPACSSSTKTARASKKTKTPTQEELKADQAARKLIAQEEAAKKSKADKKKAAAMASAKKGKAPAKCKEKKQVEKPKVATPKQKAQSQQQTEEIPAPSTIEISDAQQTPELSSDMLAILPEESATPKIPQAGEAACSQTAAFVPSEHISSQPKPVEQIQDAEQDHKIEEACGPTALELQQTQWGEPANPRDQLYSRYNCIVDLSRLDLSSGKNGYQCKIFLHPEAAAVAGVNFLANLDYSKLSKYRNPRDNNHAFSNLVEKHYGQLGTITKKEICTNGSIELHITFPGRITWIGHEMANAFQLPPNGTFEFIIIKKDMKPESYALCVHRFFRPN